jgi:excisionase family DNA binding protein
VRRKRQGSRAGPRIELAEELEAHRISVRVPDAVKLTGIKRTKLYELIKTGEIEVAKVGKATVVPIDSLKKFIDAKKG